MKYLLKEARGTVVILTLNRPDKLNAMSYELIDELMMHLDLIEVDPGVGAVVLTGAGDRAFSAGGDIPQFAASVTRGPETAIRDFVRRGQGLTARIEAFTKPVIAAVNGLAYGGGCEVTEAAHLAVASDRAMFAKPEICLGMPPAFGGTQRLPRLAGRKRAMELLLTGDAFTPEHALQLGLVNAVVPHDMLIDHALALANRIVRHSPLAVSAITTAVTRGLNASIGEGLLIESEQFARVAPTADLRSGLEAWIARRTAIYNGLW